MVDERLTGPRRIRAGTGRSRPRRAGGRRPGGSTGQPWIRGRTAWSRCPLRPRSDPGASRAAVDKGRDRASRSRCAGGRRRKAPPGSSGSEAGQRGRAARCAHDRTRGLAEQRWMGPGQGVTLPVCRRSAPGGSTGRPGIRGGQGGRAPGAQATPGTAAPSNASSSHVRGGGQGGSIRARASPWSKRRAPSSGRAMRTARPLSMRQIMWRRSISRLRATVTSTRCRCRGSGTGARPRRRVPPTGAAVPDHRQGAR